MVSVVWRLTHLFSFGFACRQQCWHLDATGGSKGLSVGIYLFFFHIFPLYPSEETWIGKEVWKVNRTSDKSICVGKKHFVTLQWFKNGKRTLFLFSKQIQNICLQQLHTMHLRYNQCYWTHWLVGSAWMMSSTRVLLCSHFKVKNNLLSALL